MDQNRVIRFAIVERKHGPTVEAKSFEIDMGSGKVLGLPKRHPEIFAYGTKFLTEGQYAIPGWSKYADYGTMNDRGELWLYHIGGQNRLEKQIIELAKWAFDRGWIDGKGDTHRKMRRAMGGRRRSPG